MGGVGPSAPVPVRPAPGELGGLGTTSGRLSGASPGGRPTDGRLIGSSEVVGMSPEPPPVKGRVTDPPEGSPVEVGAPVEGVGDPPEAAAFGVGVAPAFGRVPVAGWSKALS